MRAEEFRLASVCGLHILKHPDHVEELIQHYERAGHPTELIQLMEQVRCTLLWIIVREKSVGRGLASGWPKLDPTSESSFVLLLLLSMHRRTMP